MCIIKCSVKKRLSNELYLMDKGLKSFEDLKKEFIIEEYDSKEKYLQMIDKKSVSRSESIFQGILVYAVGKTHNVKKVKKKLDNICSKLFYRELNFHVGDLSRSTYRPLSLSFVTKCNFFQKENYKIKIALVFSHNKYLRGYLYDIPEDNLFVLNPQLTRRFIKQNKKIKEYDEIENFQTIFINKFNDFNENVLNKINKEKSNNKGSVILFKEIKTYYDFVNKLYQIMPKKSFVCIDSLG